MNKKLIKEFLIITFTIMLVFWGGCAFISQFYNFTVNNLYLRIMHIIGGFSPTIASYISLKRNNKVKNFKEWLKIICKGSTDYFWSDFASIRGIAVLPLL